MSKKESLITDDGIIKKHDPIGKAIIIFSSFIIFVMLTLAILAITY